MGFLTTLFGGGKKKKRINYIAKVKAITLPVAVEKLTALTLKNILANEMRTFKSLDYSRSNPTQLEEKTYHSFQIAILIKCIKEGIFDTLEGLNPTFHTIITKSPPSLIKKKILQTAIKYSTSVDTGNSESQLKAELIWSPLQASYMFYYIYKSYKQE
jgi:hypothetical protein